METVVNLRLKYKIWLETDENVSVFGDGKWLLLKTIEEKGSLNLAMKTLGLSYRKTWNNLRKIENTLGFELIDRQRGGAKGGKSGLTPKGKKLVELFDRFHKEYDLQLKSYLSLLEKELAEMV